MLEQISFWHWWILAAVLVVAEILTPTVIFLWLAVAAGLVGLLLLMLPQTGWQYQVLLFALFSVGSVVAWRAHLHRHPTGTDHPTLNRRAEQYVGRILTLEGAIVNGEGRVRVGDSLWRVSGADCPPNSKVRVVGTEGTVLKVETLSE